METKTNEQNLEMTKAVALGTLPYCLSSDHTDLIGKNLREICETLSQEFEAEFEITNYVSGPMKNFAALKSYVTKHSEIGDMKLEALSGMYKHKQYFKDENDNYYINENGEKMDFDQRDFNYGVNTYRLYDPATNEIYYTERGTARGEWGWDNTSMFIDGITNQDRQAVHIRKKFEDDVNIAKHDGAKIINIGHSKGGHKAIICHLYNLISGINEINSSECATKDKFEKLMQLLDKYRCYCLDSPCLSDKAVNFFKIMLEPSFNTGGFLHGADPETLLRNVLSCNINLCNMESDFASATNGKNAIGKVHIFKQTHGNGKNGHDAYTFCATKEDKNGKLHFSGRLAPIIDKHGTVHEYIANFYRTFDTKFSKDKKRQAMRYALSYIDERRNGTNQDISGALFYDKNQKIGKKNMGQEAKKSDKKVFIMALIKCLKFKNLFRVILSLFRKSKRVEDEAIMDTIKGKGKENKSNADNMEIEQTNIYAEEKTKPSFVKSLIKNTTYEENPLSQNKIEAVIDLRES